MKLYTEEQVNHIVNQVRINGFWNSKDFTPIELPTDEEINPNSPYESNSGPDEFNSDYDIGYHNGWKAGAKYVLDKIKGGQDE